MSNIKEYEWNPTDRAVYDIRFGYDHGMHELVYDGYEEGVKNADVDEWRVENLITFDNCIKILEAIKPFVAPSSEIDKSEVWKFVWGESDGSRVFYESPFFT